jgi:hypothetical protein
VQESAAAQVGSSPGEARGRQGEAACGLGQAGEPSKEPHVIGRVLVKEVTATYSPHRPPPLEGKQNGITVSL